jgi:bifunctional non-homologous end joining protein LigD
MTRARSSAALSDYRNKRDFSTTPEPRGKAAASPAAAPAFTVQRHAARRLHYDFRLEVGGVLKSWAVPRGPSLDPGEKRLAVEVEDHPLDYGEFEGEIPAGHYGAGEVVLWDRGTWQCDDEDAADALAQGHLKFSLHGFKLHGRWALVRLADGKRRAEEATAGEVSRARHNWLLIKEKDSAVRRGPAAEVTARMPGSVKRRLAALTANAPLPESLSPQLATLVAAAPQQEGWLYEIKYDGYRLLARLADGAARLFTRAGNDWTAKLPTLAKRLAGLHLDGSWLDGEIVVLDAAGIPDFQALQNAFDGKRTAPVTYYVFDAPWLAGHDLRVLPLIERKYRLATALENGKDALVAFSEHFAGDPATIAAAQEQACRLGLEGLIGKEADAPYVGERSRSWIKLKCRPRQEFVIGGFTDPRGRRAAFGALLLGVHEADGRLRYAGRVGTGFDDPGLARLGHRLAPLRIDTAPFADPPHEKDVHWVRPELVAEVAFSGWTRENQLRQASFLGLREDKPAAAIAREDAVAPDGGAAVPVGRADARVAGVRLTHPDRMLWPDNGITKSDLARYCESVAPWLLPHLLKRPLSLLRCPDGTAAECFFQKHLGRRRPAGVHDFPWQEASGETRNYLYVDAIAGVVGLVQQGIVEFHTWGSRLPHAEFPDRITLDLDPAPDLPWPRVVEGAQLARTLFEELGLACFVKTTGGKGLHLVAPIEPQGGWDEVKAFSKALAEHLARVLPDRFTANMAKNKRAGRIYADYLRNGEGATAVAAYSTRARPGAPVSTPLAWDELSAQLNPADFTLITVPARLAGLREDPWQDYEAHALKITPQMRRALGMRDDRQRP